MLNKNRIPWLIKARCMHFPVLYGADPTSHLLHGVYFRSILALANPGPMAHLCRDSTASPNALVSNCVAKYSQLNTGHQSTRA
ncbi:hypothetical protein RRG08_026092 [Elysia crispata]|uniref:Uncharacterized protein n=1 Tax=Elysia crispata TaxID=231223 RepID=A0AAE1D340_9GAST|nr:hypothetical protein RRG08_026092 [Elysia crispata]